MILLLFLLERCLVAFVSASTLNIHRGVAQNGLASTRPDQNNRVPESLQPTFYATLTPRSALHRGHDIQITTVRLDAVHAITIWNFQRVTIDPDPTVGAPRPLNRATEINLRPAPTRAAIRRRETISPSTSTQQGRLIKRAISESPILAKWTVISIAPVNIPL